MADDPTGAGHNYYEFYLGPDRSNITTHFERIPGGGGAARPTAVMGTIQKPILTPDRDTSLLPLSMNGDQDAWSLLKEASFEGGHLIALSLGGPDSEFNIAPMSKGANSGSGSWGAIEKALKATWNARNLGDTVHVSLSLSYDGAKEPTIPARVKGQIWRTAVGSTWPLGGADINIAVRPPSDRTNCLTPLMIRLFKDIELAAAATGFATLRPSMMAPNSALDFVDYKTNQTSIALRQRIRQSHPLLANYPIHGFRKKKFEPVRGPQRILLLFYNRYRNKVHGIGTGLLTAEDEDNLGLLVEEWRAQHDHSKTRSSGGRNRYSNLVLTHHRTNNLRGASGINKRPHKKRNRRRPRRYGFP